MPWFKVDDNFSTHPKVVRAGNGAMGLWVRAGSWSAAQLTDGHIPAGMVAVLGGKPADSRRLVDVGLWRENGDGWVFNDWEEYQPTKAEIVAEREAKAEAGRLGGFASGRSRRQARASRLLEPNAKQNEAQGVELPTRPVPLRTSTSVVEVDPHVQVGADVRDDLVDLEQIARATRGDHTHARRVARDVLSNARTKVLDPTAFVLTAVRADPGRHRANAPQTRARCPEHDLDLPCVSCAADRKAAR